MKEQTMAQILKNRPLLALLKEEDREALVRMYTKQLNEKEQKNG